MDPIFGLWLAMFGLSITRHAWVDRLPGGLGDHLEPSDFPKKTIRRATRVEMEHTRDPRLATEIGLDHLAENRRYYEYLGRAERQMKRDQRERNRKKSNKKRSGRKKSKTRR